MEKTARIPTFWGLASIGTAIALAVLLSFIPIARDNAGAANTPETGQSYAQALFNRVPIPKVATLQEVPTITLQPVAGTLPSNPIVVTQYYLVPSTMDIETFAHAHFPKYEWGGVGQAGDVDRRTSTTISANSLCGNRSAALCGVTYTSEFLPHNKQELRVDVAVVWDPVTAVTMPTSGTVTVSAYKNISDMEPSSGLRSVVLNSHQATQLSDVIYRLRAAPGGMCMEDSVLYSITVAPATAGGSTWSAKADLCPGTLSVTQSQTVTGLDDRSCPLAKLVASFFKGENLESMKTSLQVCKYQQ